VKDADVWFRFAALLIPQIVILIGLWMNRRPVKELGEAVERLDATMTRHLESHVAHRNTRR
jgi:hypothetical protein